MKQEFNHVDHIEQTLALGDVVACTYYNRVRVGKITKMSAKMIKIQLFKELGVHGPTSFNKYPHECVKLESDAVTFWLLKK